MQLAANIDITNMHEQYQNNDYTLEHKLDRPTEWESNYATLKKIDSSKV